jgi:hypothetical protein
LALIDHKLKHGEHAINSHQQKTSIAVPFGGLALFTGKIVASIQPGLDFGGRNPKMT